MAAMLNDVGNAVTVNRQFGEDREVISFGALGNGERWRNLCK